MLTLEVRDEVGVLRMRHGRANLQDPEFCAAFPERLVEIEGLPLRATVLTGHGATFSGGVDLKRVGAGGSDYLRTFLPAFTRCLEALFFHPKPLVVAVNGSAIAGGCLLACCGDRRLMTNDERARIGVPELCVGVPFPPVGIEILRFACAPRHLQKLVYGGRNLPPRAALEAGLVDRLLAPEALEPEAIETARRLAGLRPEVFAITKQQLREPVRARIRANESRTGARVFAIWTSPETPAAIEAYAGKTLRRG